MYAENSDGTQACLYCAFCYKSQYEVAQLVAGPNDVCICNECVMSAHGIVFDAQTKLSKDTCDGDL